MAAAYLPLTDYEKKDRPLIKAKAFQGVGKLVQEKPKQAVLITLIQKSLVLNEEENREFLKLVEENEEYKEAKMLQSVKDVGIEEGIVIGREEGREEGRKEGREEGREEEGTKLVSKLLQLKFQEKAIPYEKVLKTLSLQEIEMVSERILFSETIESVFQGIGPTAH